MNGSLVTLDHLDERVGAIAHGPLDQRAVVGIHVTSLTFPPTCYSRKSPERSPAQRHTARRTPILASDA